LMSVMTTMTVIIVVRMIKVSIMSSVPVRAGPNLLLCPGYFVDGPAGHCIAVEQNGRASPNGLWQHMPGTSDALPKATISKYLHLNV